MDLATRKRLLSASVDVPAMKISAPPTLEPPASFMDVLFLNLLNALNCTEPSQRISFLDEMISRLQRLKQYHQRIESLISKPVVSEKTSTGSPCPTEHKPLDHQQIKRCIQEDQQMLLNMSKLITLNQAHSHPTSIAPSSFQVPVIPPPPTLVTGPLKVAPASLAPVPMEIQSQEQPIKKSPAPTPSLDASNKPVAALASTPQQKESTKKTEKEQKEKAAPSVTAQPRIPHVPNTIPSKQFAQSAEVMMNDLQDKQRKLLSYISSAHNGSVTDEVLHDYLRHPFVLLKEKGVIRQQPNPFFHLMSTPQVLAGTPSVIPTPAMMSPNPAMVQKSSKPSTPIPAPPVLVPQVELPAKTSSVSQKTTVSPPVEKVTPPPQHPPQLSLQVPLNGPQMDPTKQFLVPMTRACNQWSVVSMALPLRLVCRCGQMPCRCQ